jgi:ferredoxin-NADP reductase/MOSC domain-containing protein YiiM
VASTANNDPAGRLLAVNVGLPRDVVWQGRTVRTAIWKAPVAGPRLVRRLNVDGDGQGDLAAHGGEHRAVFVYQMDSYRYWSEYLDRDDFTFGQFGENFTVEGLADDEVRIGDRMRIGGAEFEVTQPRVTCYRVAIRMDEPAMPSLLVSHRRPGFYLRVLRAGVVEAGDAIEVICAGPQQMTVADIDGLLYRPGRSRGDLRRAARIPALSRGWKASFEALLDDDQADRETRNPAWTGFREMRVASIELESDTITSFRLIDDEQPGGRARPGQYLTVRLQPDPSGSPLVRSYSISGPANSEGFRISVKRDGVASRYLHEQIRTGDRLEVAAPRGAFVLSEQRERPVVLISAGVGATPMVAMLHSLAEDGMAAPVWWIHTAHNRRQHAFAAEIDGLLAMLPAAHRVVFHAAPEATSDDGAFDLQGRLTPARLGELDLPTDGDYYVCGPPAFMDAIGGAVLASGVRPERLRTERFGGNDVATSGIVATARRAPHTPDGPVGTGPLVSFARSGLTVAWRPDYLSLLELAEACDVPADFGCRSGVCHACATPVVSGRVDYQPEPLDPPSGEQALICCAVPDSEVILDL